MITASAPGKLMLFGEHAVVDGHPCIVTAVDQRIYVTVKKNGTNIFHIEAPDLGLEAYTKTIEELGKKELPKEVRFIEMLYKRFLEKHPQNEGINVITRSDFSSAFGFGSSSAVTVAFAKALTELYGMPLDNHALFRLCYEAVLDVQGVGSGFDIAAAIWGGTLYYVPPAKVVEQVHLEKNYFVVGYTGIKADTPTLVRMVQNQKAKNPSLIGGIFERITETVNKAKTAMEEKDWEEVGRLMNTNQELLRMLQVSSVELDALIEGCLKAKAWGAKLSGAGGGDCMVAITDTTLLPEIREAILKAGGEVMEVGLGADGVKIHA